MGLRREIVALMEEECRQCGDETCMKEAYLQKLEEHAELVVHEDGGHVNGFVLFYCNDPLKDSSYLTYLLTAPSARRKGVAFSLVHYVLNISRRRGFRYCRLEVRKDNLPAIRLYEGIGFGRLEDRGEKYLMCFDCRVEPSGSVQGEACRESFAEKPF